MAKNPPRIRQESAKNPPRIRQDRSTFPLAAEIGNQSTGGWLRRLDSGLPGWRRQHHLSGDSGKSAPGRPTGKRLAVRSDPSCQRVNTVDANEFISFLSGRGGGGVRGVRGVRGVGGVGGVRIVRGEIGDI